MKTEVRTALAAVAQADPNGELTDAAVVEAAMPVSSPLHRFFTWDDSQAAVERRLDQAAGLIRRYKIEVRYSSTPTILGSVGIAVTPPREFVSPKPVEPDSEPGRYVRNTREHRIRQCQRELANLEQRYSDLAEFWDAVGKLAARNPVPPPEPPTVP